MQTVSSMSNGRASWAILVCMIVGAVPACAGVQDRYVATPLDEGGQVEVRGRTASGLVVSGAEVSSYASEHFGLVQVTFENASADWIRIRRLTLDFGSAGASRAVTVTEGPDIDSWISATLQRNVIRETNETLALGTLLAIGATIETVGASSGKRGVSAAGSMLALGAAAGLAGDAVTDSQHRAENGALFPNSHLLAVPFAIPPGLFSKRWVLLYTREQGACIRSVRLDYELDAHGSESVHLVFRRPGEYSEWQRGVCAGDGPRRRR